MKAYRQDDDTVRLFRPDMNMARMNRVSRAATRYGKECSQKGANKTRARQDWHCL